MRTAFTYGLPDTILERFILQVRGDRESKVLPVVLQLV
jgi:hypothetical protein